jgi:hypothetical protein
MCHWSKNCSKSVGLINGRDIHQYDIKRAFKEIPISELSMTMKSLGKLRVYLPPKYTSEYDLHAQCVCDEQIVKELVYLGYDMNLFPKEVLERIKHSSSLKGTF